MVSMFSNVLVGVDGGPGGRDAVALARVLAVPDSQLTLAHVYPGEEHPSRASSPSYDAVQEEAASELLSDELLAADVSAGTAIIRASSVARGLHHLVAERGIDLLVVGSCRRGIVGRVMLGDDARASLRLSKSVVAVAPRQFASTVDPIRTIGVGFDDSEESEAAFALARDIAERFNARIRAMTVVTPPRVGYGAPLAIEFIEAGARERLDELNGEGQVAHGIAARKLAELGGEVDLLVVGSHQRGPLGRVVFGSTSENLARIAQCPLIVVPHEAVESRRRRESPVHHEVSP